MPLVNRDLFVKTVMDQPNAIIHLCRGGQEFARTADRMRRGELKVDRESALALLDQMGAAVVDGYQMGKGCRPWDITSKVFEALDRTKPWWGFEFETGWRSRDAYKEAVRHVWDNYDGCMFDGEGEGAHSVEITFCPSEMHTYLDGTAPAFKFVEWMDANAHLPYNGGGNDVGTHVNMSDPRFSGNKDNNVDRLVRFLNRTLHFTQAVNGQRREMFGRESIYAGFFHNYSNNNTNHWMEFKGFRTTYDLAEFKNYIKTCEGLQKVVDCYYRDPAAAEGCGVSNLYDVVFNGAEPVIAPFADVKIAAGAAALHTRYGGNFAFFGAI